MSEQVAFLEVKYGKIYQLDVHGLTLEEAKAELVYTLDSIDVDKKAVLVTHGYHRGTVLRDFIRIDFKHKNIRKIINIDASRTLLLVNMER